MIVFRAMRACGFAALVHHVGRNGTGKYGAPENESLHGVSFASCCEHSLEDWMQGMSLRVLQLSVAGDA